MPRWIPLSVSLLAFASSGCFSGLVDVDGLDDTRPGSDASPLDDSSSPDGGDASETDASQPDVSQPDSSPGDASWPDVPQPDSEPAEAGDALEDSPEDSFEDAPEPDAGGWCETQGAGALFCDDFEGAIAWDEYNVSPKAQLDLTTTFSSSPLHSLQFHSDALTQEGTGEGYRAKSMGTFGQSFTLSYELWVELVPSAAGAAIASQLILSDGADKVLLSILVGIPYEVSLEVESRPSGQQASYSSSPLAGTVPKGQWVKVEYIVAPAPWKLTIRLNGSPALANLPLAVLGSSDVDAAFRIGACYVEAPSDPWTFVYDNVVFR